jgi:hypothetical protein
MNELKPDYFMRSASVLVIVCVTVLNLAAQPMVGQDGGSDPAAESPVKTSRAFASPKSDPGYQYTQGTLVFNAGISVGLIGDYSYFGLTGASGFLPVTLSGEYSVNEIIGASAYFGFYDRNWGSGAYKYNVVTFGGRLVAHATDLLNDKLKTKLPERLDLYATLILGYRHYAWSSNDGASVPDSGGKVTFGPAIGARYMIIKNVGVYVELGRGPFGVLGTGISVKI